MSTKLFKNTEGKVLMSVGNKLIKQPYESGLAFQNRMGLKNYIEMTGLNIGKGWSIMGICDTTDIPVTSGGSGFLQLAPSTLNIADNIMLQGGRTLMNLIDNIGLIQVDTIDRQKKVFYYQLTNNSGCDNGNTISYATNNIDTILRTNLRLGASASYSGNLYNLTEYLHPLIKINKLIILDRIIPLSEYKYFRNNLLFNDLQSDIGVKHSIVLNKAEIINIDGVDQVCVRDSVGDRHGLIKNLPAGTTQQKVDYANANLFVQF